jgi:hypothetical protein
MVRSKTCFFDDLTFSGNGICETANDLMQCKDMYILMERFCSLISREDAQFDLFLNKYFNDEGYVDIWRIPHLMLDIYNCNFKFRGNILDDCEFKDHFIEFLGLFYNYCLTEYRPYHIKDSVLNDSNTTVLQIKSKKLIMNMIMDTYIRIIENLQSYKISEKGVISDGKNN